MLWAWLQHECGGNRAAHVNFEPDFDACEIARNELYLLDGCDDWFLAEVDNEDPLYEPFHVVLDWGAPG